MSSAKEKRKGNKRKKPESNAPAVKTKGPTAIPEEVESHLSAMGFLSAAFAVLGVGCFLYYTQLFIALHQFVETKLGFLALPFPGSVFNSEAVVLTLTFVWLPLGAIHLACHLHLRHARASGGKRHPLPGSVFKTEIPPRLSWLRWIAFVLLLAWPTFVHCFAFGRLVDHYGITDRNLLPGPDKLVAPANERPRFSGIDLAPANAAAVTGTRLFSARPAMEEGRHYAWDSSHWTWINTHRGDEVRAGKLVVLQAYPVVQPWGILGVSAALAASLLSLIGSAIRVWRTRSHETKPKLERKTGKRNGDLSTNTEFAERADDEMEPRIESSSDVDHSKEASGPGTEAGSSGDDPGRSISSSRPRRLFFLNDEVD